MLKSIKKYGDHRKVVVCDLTTIDFKESSFDYIWDNIEKFEEAYGLLADEKSKDIFGSMLNYRITRDTKYLKGIVDDEDSQYFDESLGIDLHNATIVDAGAFIGDTVEKIVEKINMEYKKIICFEPDRNTYELLLKNIKDNKRERVECHNLAVYSVKRELHFDTKTQGGGSSNHISEDGNEVITANTIDNIVQEQVDIIKMDVEGAEVEAIKGCKKIIMESHPMLAICVYHKKDDFYTIPLLIHSLYSGYKLYFRQYSSADAETVCYAIP